MEEKKSGKIVYLIGGLAFMIAAVSLAFSLLDLVSAFQAVNGNIQAVIMELYDMVIDIVFAFLELTAGFSLIKQWKSGERIEIHKTIAQLISALVYASFVTILLGELISGIMLGGFSNLNVNLSYIVVYILYGLLVGATPSLIKKHKLMQLYWVMLLSSIIAVGFCGYDVFVALLDGAEGVPFAIEVANVVLMVLITVFATQTIVFYIKNPDILYRDVRENEDAEVVETKGNYETVKIYATRGTDDKVNVVISILTILSVITGVAGIVFFAVENNIAQYFVGDLGDVIDTFISMFMSAGLSGLFDAMLMFMLVFIYTLIYLSLAVGVFTKKGSLKVGVTSIASIGVTVMIFANVSLTMDLIMDFMFTHKINFEKYSILQLIVLGLYIVYKFSSKAYANVVKDINDGIVKRGDSYHSHSKSIARVVLLSGLYSIVGLALVFLTYYLEGVTLLSYVMFLLSTLFIVIVTQLEVKHPFSEYSKVRRRIRNIADTPVER